MKLLLRCVAAAGLCMTVLVSCATQRGVEVQPKALGQVRVDDITKLIAEDKPLDAIAQISALQGSAQTDIPATQLQALFHEAQTKTQTLFQKAVSSQDYQQAIQLFDSAQQYDGTNALAGWTRGKLLVELARSYLKKGMDIPALLTFRKALAAGADPGSDLTTFGDLALSENDRTTIGDVVDYLSKHKMQIPAAYTKLLDEVVAPDKVISGVVMVWVNLGIELQNGVGVPHGEIGTAFFIDKTGYLITNYHVIRNIVDPKYRGYARLFVVPYNNPNDRIPARVVGYDKVFDIALLKTEMKPGYIFSFGGRYKFQPGEQIYAVGSPGGLQNTMTSGIVSATGRRFLQLGDTLQVDVPLNPGNSGGPLLDQNSQLMGINFAGIPEFQGINFSIPANWVQEIIPELYAGGEVTHPWLGVDLHQTVHGLEVIYVFPGSPADEAGIKPGDILETVNGTTYTKVVAAQNALLDFAPGTLVKVTWQRSGKPLQALIALGKRPFVPLETALARDTREKLFPPLFGMEVERTSSFLWQTSYRVTKVYSGSVADETGLSPGDPITVNGWQVDKNQGVVILQFYVKKRTAGFLGSEVQIGGSLKNSNFL